MEEKLFLYFASYSNSPNNKWFSAGANKKIEQTLSIFKANNKKAILINYTPKEINNKYFDEINICNHSNPFIYRLEILISTLKIRRFIELKKYKINLLIYNSTFESLLFYFSLRIFGINPKISIEVEDLPFARSRNLALLRNFFDNFALNFLYRKSKFCFFASEIMRENIKDFMKYKKEGFIYPPSISEKFLDLSRSRKEPFTSDKIRIIYAGGFKKEKGVFELINAFIKANLKNAVLYLYGPSNKDIRNLFKEYSSIKFKGVVSYEKLLDAYLLADIIVNPHLKIINNQYIFPCKNIEILASGALPLISTYSLAGLTFSDLPKNLIFKDQQQLTDLIIDGKNLWFKEKKKINKLSKYIREKYSHDSISKTFANAYRF